MNKPKHDKIWLRPDMWDGERCWCWCEDIAPFIDDEEDDADGPYIHADVLRKLVDEWRYVGSPDMVTCADALETYLNKKSDGE